MAPWRRGSLCRLGGDPTRRVRMGEAARRYFEKEATVEVMARRYLEVVDDVRARGVGTGR